MTRLLAAFAGFAGILGLLVWIAAGALATASERTVTYRYIADALTPVAAPAETVVWNAPAVPLDRAVTPADEALIGRALSDAWQALAVAQSTGRRELLEDTFTGVALARAARSVTDANAGGGRLAVLAIAATPVFYHLDGSVFQAEVELIAARFMATGEGHGHAAVSRDRGVITLMNESSGWRVFSYELRDSALIEPTPTIARLPDLQGVNYYPAGTPWREFWPTYDPGIIAADFARIVSLGANAVRVFLPRDDFLDTTERETRLADLGDLLARAEDAGLLVIPTLFDLKGDYGPGTWAGDAAYLQAVLPVLAGAGNVAFIDLKNEPDLDFTTHGTPTVTAWLRTMAALARIETPAMPLTIGWSDAVAAPLLSDVLEVITYHDYAPPNGASERLARVRATAKGKPVMVTEIGTSSYEIALGFPGSPEAQASALAGRLTALEEADGVLVWTLHDFTRVDSTAVGASPWVRRKQAAFGLFATDGSEKPAAASVRAAFGNRSRF